jgi:hypothetical protein
VTSKQTNHWGALQNSWYYETTRQHNCVMTVMTCLLRCLKVEFLSFYASCVAVFSIWAAPSTLVMKTPRILATAISETCYQPQLNTCYWMEKCKLVSSVCASPFSNMCSTQADDNSRKLRLLCDRKFPRCALARRRKLGIPPHLSKTVFNDPWTVCKTKRTKRLHKWRNLPVKVKCGCNFGAQSFSKTREILMM